MNTFQEGKAEIRVPRQELNSVGDHSKIVKWLAGALVALNDHGLERKALNQIEQLGPQIANDLQYAGGGGVLVVARIQAAQTEAGPLRSLISDRVDYVGIGASAAEAELSNASNPNKDPFYTVSPGDKRDLEASTAFWFRMADNGEVIVERQLGTLLRNSVLLLYSERTLANFNWLHARDDELRRLIILAMKNAELSDVRKQIEMLENSRQDALKELANINKRLEEELKSAASAEKSGAWLKLFGAALTLAAFIAKAQDGLSPADRAAIGAQTSKDDVLAELNAVEERATGEANLLQEKIISKSNVTNGIEKQIIVILRQKRVPVDNLPPGRDPELRP